MLIPVVFSVFLHRRLHSYLKKYHRKYFRWCKYLEKIIIQTVLALIHYCQHTEKLVCHRLADCVQHIITSKCVKPIWMSVRGL